MVGFGRTYGPEKDALRRRLSGSEYEAELEKLVARRATKQDAQLQQTLKDYVTIQDELIARLKSRAGTAWMLHDFNLNHLRTDAAKAFAHAVYVSFCYDLASQDPARRKALGVDAERSRLDWFLRFNSDQLIVRADITGGRGVSSLSIVVGFESLPTVTLSGTPNPVTISNPAQAGLSPSRSPRPPAREARRSAACG